MFRERFALLANVYEAFGRPVNLSCRFVVCVVTRPFRRAASGDTAHVHYRTVPTHPPCNGIAGQDRDRRHRRARNGWHRARGSGLGIVCSNTVGITSEIGPHRGCRWQHRPGHRSPLRAASVFRPPGHRPQRRRDRLSGVLRRRRSRRRIRATRAGCRRCDPQHRRIRSGL